jgi:N-acetylglucosaminyl-diphospho-decaprenol L-rhamnosyltransferase
MTCRIAISIINYRTGPMTIACVTSVLADIGDLDAQVVVVDNASGDGSADQIADWIAAQPAGTPVRLVRSERNTGFSGGHNLGMAAVRAGHYLILNSDALLRPRFLAHILAAADANPRAGLVAPQIETDDGDIQISCFRFHSPASELIRGAASGPVTRVLQRHVVALPPRADPEAVEWASFACILLRGEMVDQIGPMDEGYFLYFEDAAYCLTARRAGWGIVQERRAVAVHYKGGSGPVEALGAARKRLPAYYYSARTRFFYQAHGHMGLLLANLMWLSGRGLAHLRRFAGKPVPKAMDAETQDLWTNFMRPLGPRHAPEE